MGLRTVYLYGTGCYQSLAIADVHVCTHVTSVLQEHILREFVNQHLNRCASVAWLYYVQSRTMRDIS